MFQKRIFGAALVLAVGVVQIGCTAVPREPVTVEMGTEVYRITPVSRNRFVAEPLTFSSPKDVDGKDVRYFRDRMIAAVEQASGCAVTDHDFRPIRLEAVVSCR